MQLAKQILRRILPMSARNFIWYMRSPDLRHALSAAGMIRKRLGSKVLSGPFAGLSYIERSIGSSYPPKLLGTYEKELWPALDQILRAHYKTIIDIGAAEGYYAVGLAWRIPQCRVIAFEAQTDQHALFRDLAQRNNVDHRITLRGFCTPSALNESLSAAERALIISDCEGFERDLLDPNQRPALQHCDLLVETHELPAPGVCAELRKRFAPTHDIEEFIAAPRFDSDWPAAASFVPQRLRSAAMNESRFDRQTWFWMKSRATASGTAP